MGDKSEHEASSGVEMGTDAIPLQVPNATCLEKELSDKSDDVSVQPSGLLKDLSSSVVHRAADVFELVLVASSCVVIWFAMWTLMDMVIPFKEQYIWVTLMAGFCGSFSCIYLEKIPCILSCIQHSTTKRLAFKFVHDFLITWFQVTLWYGWWNLLDLYTSSTFPQVSELLLSMGILISCRALTVSAQYSICKENIWTDPIESDTLSTGVNETANITVTLSLIHILSITAWTQVWNLTDTFLLPDHYYLSTSYSLAFGVLSLSLLFLFDQIKNYIFCCCSGKLSSDHSLLQLVYYVMATVGLVASIQTWRGSWGIAEYYLEFLHDKYGHEKSTEAWLMLGVMLLVYLFIFTFGYSQNVGSYALDFDKSDFSLDKYFLIWSDRIGAEFRQVNEPTNKSTDVENEEQPASTNVARTAASANTSKSVHVSQNPNRLPTEDDSSSQKPLLLELSDEEEEEDEIMTL